MLVTALISALTPRSSIAPATLLLAILWAPSVLAQGSVNETPLSLPSAVEKTLQQHPNLAGYALRHTALLGKRLSAEQNPAWQIEVELENLANTGDENIASSMETTIALSSTIELGDKKSARVAIVDAQQALLTHQQQANTLDVLGQLSRDYIETLALQQQVTLTQSALALATKNASLLQRKAELGTASDAHVIQAQVRIAQLTLTRDSLRTQLNIAHRTLSQYWAETTPSFDHLSGDLLHLPQSKSWDALYTLAQQSPSTQILASQQRLANAQWQLSKSQKRTDIGWSLGIRHMSDTGDNGLVAGLSIPLGTQKRNRGDALFYSAERDALLIEQQQQVLTLHSQLYQAYHLRENALASVRTLQHTILPALRKALTLTQTAYERGRYDFIELERAQSNVLVVQQQLIDTAKQAHLQQVIIEQLTGQAL